MNLTYKEYLAKPRSFQEQWDRAVQVVSRMRDGASQHQASREFGIRFETVLRLVGSGLRKLPGGRYVARPTDRLLRVLPLPAERGGLQWIPTADSREASFVGKFWNVVDEALRTGSPYFLSRFSRQWIIDEAGIRVPLLRDFRELKRLASAGVLRFESMYGGRA
jgi:hypothetical protein